MFGRALENSMSILVYRDDSGADVVIHGPSRDDWSAFCGMIANRHKDEIRREFLKEFKRSGSPLLAAIGE